MMIVWPLLPLLLATTVLAAPSHTKCECEDPPVPVPVSALDLPSNQTQIVRPNTDPDYSALGFGYQNYTCTNSGNYTSAGAVARLYDISHLAGTPEYLQVQVDAYNCWSNYPDISPYDPALTNLVRNLVGCVLGDHYFINGSTGALSPKFDFTSSGPNKGNPEAFVVAAKSGDIPAPDTKQDVDWLRLNGTSGELATEVIRMDTRGGQPPSSCTPGSPKIQVKYVAKYYFFGSKLDSSATSS